MQLLNKNQSQKNSYVILPIPNSQFPIPNSQFPIPNSQLLILNADRQNPQYFINLIQKILQ